MEQKILEQKPTPERGSNVTILIKFMRHGDRNKKNELIPEGVEIIKERARESGIKKGEFDYVKPIGSNVDPKTPHNLGRSLETAQIYAREIEGDEVFNTRASRILNYKTLKNPTPYDHEKIYNSFLPPNYDQLSGEEQIEANKTAQKEILNHAINLQTPEAEEFRKEVAGSFAYVLEHYRKIAKRLKSGKAVLIPAGVHGGTMEYLLQQALSRKGEDGKEKIGFSQLVDIGGEFASPDSYNVVIETDENGEYKRLRINFDDPKRPQEEMYIDENKLKELAEYYRNLHADELKELNIKK
ncbi:MAG: hypothetical protein AAB513_02420 [Patescibacteria group bacterium]